MAPIANLPALTETWNEATIAGTMEANLLDNYQQEHKRASRERFSVDHYVLANEVGQVNIGAHKVIHLLTQGADPLALTDAGELYCKDVGGVAELFWQDEAENIVQLTSGGAINAVGVTGDYTIAGLITFSQFPVTPSAAPTADYQVANKKYVDDQISALSIAYGVGFGSWLARAAATVYQAATDGFVVAYAQNVGAGSYVTILSDGANPPTTIRVNAAGGGAVNSSAMCPVRKDDYWRANLTGGNQVVYWIPVS